MPVRLSTWLRAVCGDARWPRQCCLRQGIQWWQASGKAALKPIQRLAATLGLPPEIVRGDWTVLILALMMFFAPAMGVPNEEMLQDTLKSAIVSFAAVSAALLFFWRQRNRRDGLRWHALMWFPLALDGLCVGQHGLVAHLSGRGGGDPLVHLQPVALAGPEHPGT